MGRMNEELIRQVFAEMLKYRPSLQKYVFEDEEEDEDTADYRLLGDLIIKNFPWPIGVELRRLFSGSMRQLDRLRLDQIFKTIERTMQFISFVLVSQLWKEKVIRNITLPENFSRDFPSKWSVLSMGIYTWLIHSICKIFQSENIPYFMPEMEENLNKKFHSELDFWVPERNEIGHYQINLSKEEIEKRCVEYEEKLTWILKKIAFLTKYKLISVKEIKVDKSRTTAAIFHHTIELLNSSDSDFKGREIDENKYSESRSVLLMKSIKSIEEYLNLSPLIIDTSSEILDTKEKFDIKKDIFLYTKYRNDHIYYLGTEVTEQCDLQSLSNYANLLSEYKDLIETLK